ncbi:MAG: hypothetical protein KAU62_00495 [Candidatus Heimdallarchaeota archaeon]|nr:hypothetical protein [Candidatus Heimdallarchaeota archaeon]MCK4609610.1 hypothetical protein [Candidatus Heimdallarchaeota archaeon]
MSSRYRINKLILDKLEEKNIDDDLKELICNLLKFEISNFESKYSTKYERFIEQYLRKRENK